MYVHVCPSAHVFLGREAQKRRVGKLGRGSDNDASDLLHFFRRCGEEEGVCGGCFFVAPMWFDMLEEEEEEGGAAPFPSPLHGWVLVVLFYGPLPLSPTLPRFHPSPYPLSECILWKKAMDPPPV